MKQKLTMHRMKINITYSHRIGLAETFDTVKMPFKVREDTNHYNTLQVVYLTRM